MRPRSPSLISTMSFLSRYVSIKQLFLLQAIPAPQESGCAKCLPKSQLTSNGTY